MLLKQIILLIVFICIVHADHAIAQERPNILFFLVDDLGWSDVGYNGSTFYDTPNIDRLAKEGMVFTDAYASSMCSATRASIMTGKSPARLKITTWFGDAQPDNYQRNTPLVPAASATHLPLSEVTIAEALRDRGYTTMLAGKWHLGKTGYFPEDQGFDVNKGGTHWSAPNGGNKYFSPYENPRLEDGPIGEHLPDRLARETMSFIEENKERPFFAYLSFYSVHSPFMGREDLVEKYEEKDRPADKWREMEGNSSNRRYGLVQNNPVYAAMVEAMDEAVGKVLKKVSDLGLEEKTIVVFVSDNGGAQQNKGFNGGIVTSNAPLRAGKCHLYEGGIRVPMIVRWPGKIAGSTQCQVPVITEDFYPTLLDLAGLEALPDQHQDGISIVPLLKGNQTINREALFWHFPHYAAAEPSSAVRKGNWKLIEFFDGNRIELYNLKDDIGEYQNIVDAHPEIADDLKEKLYAWRDMVDANMPAPNPRYQN